MKKVKKIEPKPGRHAFLSFALPEEEWYLNHAMHGASYAAALCDLWNDLFRKRMKYVELTRDQEQMLEAMIEEWNEITAGLPYEGD